MKLDEINIKNILIHKDFNKLKKSTSYNKLKELINIYPTLNKLLFSHLYVKNFAQFEKNQYLFQRENLKKELSWTILALNSSKNELEFFIKKERELFYHIFFNEFEKCFKILDVIEENLSLSQWSIFMRMSIHYLNNDINKMDEYSDSVIEEIEKYDKLFFLRESIFFHKKKLAYLNDNYSFEEVKNLIYENLFQNMNAKIMDGWNATDSEILKFNKKRQKLGLSDVDTLLKEISIDTFKYCEKFVLSPFNKLFNNIELSKVLFSSSTMSIIDLYKTFSQVYSELLFTDSSTLISKEQEIEIQKFSYKTNIIKNLENENSSLDYQTKKLFIVFEYFIRGYFEKVINISLRTLKSQPYLVDYIYFLVASMIYLSKPINSIIDEKIHKDTFLYKMINILYCIYSNKDLEINLNKMKSLLLIFGIYSRWNMYLYFLIKNFLCQNNDKLKISFSKALIYSYLNHPRLFYKISNKDNLQKFIENTKFKKFITYNIFLSKINNIKINNIDEEIKPIYRAKYLDIINNENRKYEDLKELYLESKDKPFIFSSKVETLYIDTLIKLNHFKKALILIVENVFYLKIPLCLYNYEVLLNLENSDTLKGLPHYPLLFIYHDKNNTIKNYHITKMYLDSFIGCDYSRPSTMIKEINKEDKYYDIKLELSRNLYETTLLEEFVFQFNCSKNVIMEQIEILSSIAKHTKLNKKEELDLSRLNKELIYISDHHQINHGRLEFNIKDIYTSDILTMEKISNKNRWDDNSVIHWEHIKINYQEEVVQDFLIKEIRRLFYGKNGISDEIEGKIKHTFFHETIKQPLNDYKLITKLSNEKVFLKIEKWNNDDIEKILFEFTEKINYEINAFKETQLKVEKLDNGYYNFMLENMYKKDEIINIVDKINSSDITDQEIRDDLIFKINEELERYSIILGEELKKIFLTLLSNLEIKVKDIQYQKIKQLKDAIQSATKELEANLKKIASWVKVKKFTREHPYVLQDLFNVLEREFTNIINFSNLSVPSDSEIQFKAFSFHYLLYIFHNIFTNITKHSNSANPNINITISFENEFLILIIENNHCLDKPTEIIENRGMVVIRNALESINSKNKLFYKMTPDRFIYTLSFIKEGFFHETI